MKLHFPIIVILFVGGDCEEGLALSLAVPSTSPPAHVSPTGMMKDSATPPPSPSLSGGLAALGFVYNIVQICTALLFLTLLWLTSVKNASLVNVV